MSRFFSSRSTSGLAKNRQRSGWRSSTSTSPSHAASISSATPRLSARPKIASLQTRTNAELPRSTAISGPLPGGELGDRVADQPLVVRGLHLAAEDPAGDVGRELGGDRVEVL